MKTAVVIVAAGRGTRMADGETAVPKQYRPLAGAPLLRRTIAAFAEHPGIDGVLAVIHPDDRARYDEAAAPYAGRLPAPVAGGATRQGSVLAGLRALAGDNAPEAVLIHDAARPFPSPALIGRVIAALETGDGAVPALPVSDTLKQGENGRIAGTVDRTGLWAAQTPQGFRFAAILEAHEAAAKADRHDFTDDAAIAEWHGMAVTLVEGDNGNLKLTTTADFALAESLAGAGEMRIGQGWDAHAFGEGDHVTLCGVTIPHDRALVGHSDADAGLHALTDALLGAIGEADIGAHFPPSDPQWKDASSDIFLRAAAERVRARCGVIVNIDVTVICEAPKIAPHRQAMREKIAAILGIEAERVGVKATTSEGLGFTGRGEGVAASAAATVRLA